jgi:methyltransferase
MFFYIFILFLIVQRLAELNIARRNENISKRNGGIEYDTKGYKIIVLMHVSFFIFFIAEFVLFKRQLSGIWIILLIIFIFAQILRYWAITSLGTHWNTKIIIIPGEHLIIKGPYKYFSHPNYIAVIIEIAVIPLLFSCYFTSIIFTLLNLIVLKRRIRIEEEALNSLINL